MTIKKTSALILALALAIAAAAVPAAAAQADKKDTTATVTFEPDTSGPGGAALYLREAPSFNFGNQTISPGDETYAAAASPAKQLVVVDGRGSLGWTVTAKIDEPFTGETSGADLTGSRISITGGTITYGADVQTLPPAPTQPPTIILNNSGETTAVLTAAEGQGGGIWIDELDVVNLEVPGGIARAEAYKASILWTLNDVPA